MPVRSLRMAKILIADDQPSFLTTLEKIVSQCGHSAVKATNVFDAIEKLKNEKFDVLITDAIIPGRTGYDLVTSLRKMPAFENFPVIMFSDSNTLVVKLDNILFKNSIESAVFHSVAVNISVQWQDTTEVIELSEIGTTLRTNMQLSIGTKIHLDDEFYNLIGITRLALRVVQCVPDKEHKGYHKIKAYFVEPQTVDVTAIKKFLLVAQTAQKAS